MTKRRDHFHLEGLTGQFEGQVIELLEDLVWLGRAQPGTPSASTHLLFDDSSVSRVHGALQWNEENNTYVLHHRSQTNPTFLNNETVSQPCLLKLGDVLTFGRQSFRFQLKSSDSAPAADVEVGPVKKIQLGVEPGDEPAPIAEPEINHPTLAITPPAKVISIGGDTPEIKVGFRIGGKLHTATSEKTVCFKCSPGHNEVQGPEIDESGEIATYCVPGESDSEIHVHLYVDGSYAVEAKSGEHASSRRVSRQSNVYLELPIKATTRVPLNPKDIVLHQGHTFWVADAQGGEQDGVLPDFNEAFGHFELKSGNWRGAKIHVLESSGTEFKLGPLATLCEYELPMASSPTCRITTDSGTVGIAVTEALEVNYMSINGELLFLNKSTTLLSGSDLFMGNLLLTWYETKINRALKKYNLVSGQDVFAISKAAVRIGSGAQCEIKVENKNLPTIAGTVKFGAQGFSYKHHDASLPSQVDGQNVQATQEVPLTATIQLGPDCTFQLASVD